MNAFEISFCLLKITANVAVRYRGTGTQFAFKILEK